MKMVYGYVRISTKKQSITRQIENISKYDTASTIIEETFTGTTTNRPKWTKLKKELKSGDTVIFDSVSRMSRNAAEGMLQVELEARKMKKSFRSSPINYAPGR